LGIQHSLFDIVFVPREATMLAAETADPQFFSTCFTAVLGLVGAGLGILAAVFWLGMTINVLFREEGPPRERIAWAVFVIAVPLLGAAVYYFARFRPRARRRKAEEDAGDGHNNHREQGTPNAPS
jgi:hypothetical protein